MLAENTGALSFTLLMLIVTVEVVTSLVVVVLKYNTWK